MTTRRYFGTDGIRGVVGKPPITPEFVLKLGWAAGRVLKNGTYNNKVLIGKDTRISGYMFESALEAGLSAAGMDVHLLGPMPTPAIAYLTRTFHAQAGIVISASHNAFQDNGIKFFSSQGKKLPDKVECAIETELDQPLQMVDVTLLGKAKRIADAAGRYIEFCKRTIPYDVHFKGLKVVVDCAHGATYHIAPHVLSELGAEVITLGVEPNGFNINEQCGVMHPHALQQAVRNEKADLGIALDGDGDRVLMVDAQGELVDGDELLFIIAQARQQQGELHGPVVGTLMSNFGLEQALQKLGIDFIRAKVGDRYVLEALHAHNGNVGGESSGHLICLDRTTTGDGIVTALQILTIAHFTNKSLQELKNGMQKYPQQLINVPISGNGKTLLQTTRIQTAVQAAEQALAGQGRVLLRPSGTEPLIRVMAEGQDAALVQRITEQLADSVKQAAGGEA